MIEELQAEVYEKLNSIHETCIDELDKDFDFINVGVFFTVNNINSFGSRSTLSLQIFITSEKNNKLEMQNIAENIDEKINNRPLNCNAIIRRQAVWLNSFIDDDGLSNIVLNYYIDKF